MKILKKTLLIVLITSFLGVFGVVIYLSINLPHLPKVTNRIIERTLEKGPKKLTGQQGYAVNDSVNIWYETLTPTDTVRGNIILIMGIANDALAWPEFFTSAIVDKGYRVIRYDHRGTGMSDWMVDWSPKNAYSLDDMAADVIAILDTLNIDKVHIVGASLGGMIGQQLAINYPDRVITLTSMMSTGDIMDKTLPPMNPETLSELAMVRLRYNLWSSNENTIKQYIMMKMILSNGECSEEDIEGIANSVAYNILFRKGYNNKAANQHSAAVVLSGSRYDDLANLTIPVLVVHGKDDPLINFAHGEKCFNTLPNADKLWIDNMGHDINKANSPVIVENITNLIESSTYE